jgi:UDP-N-acetylglucosamine 4,6-dehydratase/5-epimerase
MIRGKTVLIIGGTGSLGYTLTHRYLAENRIFIYSRGENNQWKMKQDFGNHNSLFFFVGDIRDKERMETCIFRSKPNIIIIAAALKHIDICEKNINECINTNIDGIRTVVNIITTHAMSSQISFLDIVLFISTDKACAPVNAYGMCKAVSERIMIEKTEFLTSPRFITVRYGNVLQSRGSLIPMFKNIGEDPLKKYFTITSTEMTRFFMPLEDSVDLIDHAIKKGRSGTTIIPKHIVSYRIKDIVNEFSKKYRKPVQISGIRPGEKIHETLISFTESLRTTETDRYYVIHPTYEYVEDPVFFEGGEFNSMSNVKPIDSRIIDLI